MDDSKKDQEKTESTEVQESHDSQKEQLKKKYLGLPIWGWMVIVFALFLVLIVVVSLPSENETSIEVITEEATPYEELTEIKNAIVQDHDQIVSMINSTTMSADEIVSETEKYIKDEKGHSYYYIYEVYPSLEKYKNDEQYKFIYDDLSLIWQYGVQIHATKANAYFQGRNRSLDFEENEAVYDKYLALVNEDLEKIKDE